MSPSGPIASIARRGQVVCSASNSEHQISRADLPNNERRHSIPATRRQIFGERMTAHKTSAYRAASCPGVEWRATVDEDGQYCFAVAL